MTEAFVTVHSIVQPAYTSPFANISTTSDVNSRFISGTCVARDWAELDWTHADDGYVTVRVNKLPGPNTRAKVTVEWADGTRYGQSDTVGSLSKGEWHIPLRGGSTEYVVELSSGPVTCIHLLTEAESTVKTDPNAGKIIAKFNAEISNPEAEWVLSTPRSNYENAPKTQAKALELTKNCKTDAEKITAIFNWVIDNIEYDHELSDALDTWYDNATDKTGKKCSLTNPNGQHITVGPSDAVDYYDLDRILADKSGVCAHYAVLTVGMLRSIGIPCRTVGGKVYNDAEWNSHAWVEISPSVTGLNKTALGAGTGEDGWTRIDPTFAATGGATGRSLAMNDNNYKFEDFYF